jgi:cell division septation protein DedD
VQKKIVTDKPITNRSSPDSASDIKKKVVSPAVTPQKSVQQKKPPEMPVNTRKVISPVQPDIKKPVIKQEVILKEKDSPPKDNTSEKAGKKISMKRQQGITDGKFREVFSKYLSILIFAVLLILLVILSMFIGRIMDYDGMFASLKNRYLSVSIHGPVPKINDSDTKNNNISMNDKTLPLKETPVESSDIKGPGTIKTELEAPDNTLSMVLENRSDAPSKNITTGKMAYPYSIYLGSYNSLASVKELSSDYMKLGITSYWIKLDLGEKGVWYRLYAGCFHKREEADEYIKTWNLKDAESKNTKYANLIGSYISKEDAEKQKRHMEERGYSAYIIMDAKDAFRLYTGAFYQQEQAEAQKRELESDGIRSLVVER